MERIKKIAKAVCYPHIGVIIVLAPLSAVLLVYSFVYTNAADIVRYFSYFLSAYALTTICFRTPAMIRFFRSFKEENRYVNHYLNDPRLRVNISLYSSLFFNSAYALFQLGLGFYHHTVWYYSLAGYYIVLGVMRFFLLKHTRTHQAKENRWLELLIYRFCGVLLLLMNLALSVVITYIVLQKRVFIHHEITTIALAAYTFTALSVAIINVIKYKKYDSPVFSASKAVSLASALVSVITLESAMFASFGDGSEESLRLTITAITGFAVTAFILGMSIYMIVRSTKQIKATEKPKR